ncbi:hypothetical protein [Pseudogemmobacter bohemicus]|uniref:hypothetical protein n=1 Tax=Pseudogemmobacter bohemicus TaxID=2250708 RepID=UPI001300ACBA|nr:hypothetical protein [Pseudogemmobacter bohemicus]
MKAKFLSMVATAVMLASTAATHAQVAVDVDVNGDGNNVTVEVTINENAGYGQAPVMPGGILQLVGCYLPGAPVDFVTFSYYYRPAAYTPCYADMQWGGQWWRFHGYTV